MTGAVAQRPIVSADQEDAFLNAQYYDLGLCLYLAYYRSGDARLLQQARDVADAWWRGLYILDGENRDFSNTLAPRNVSLGSLMLRALDGRPEMWP